MYCQPANESSCMTVPDKECAVCTANTLWQSMIPKGMSPRGEPVAANTIIHHTLAVSSSSSSACSSSSSSSSSAESLSADISAMPKLLCCRTRMSTLPTSTPVTPTVTASTKASTTPSCGTSWQAVPTAVVSQTVPVSSFFFSVLSLPLLW